VGLTGDLLHDAFLVVVTQGARQLVVVHRRPVLLRAPAARHLLAHALLHLLRPYCSNPINRAKGSLLRRPTCLLVGIMIGVRIQTEAGRAHLFGLMQLELEAAAGPGDAARALRQQRHQELPQLQRTTPPACCTTHPRSCFIICLYHFI
jgi:hypothetical protein